MMVDGTLAPGQSVDTVWGSTPVTLIAPYPQSQVAQLYDRLNILLAPSTWPESFGLVAREALHSGLWVIASTLGAMAQQVEDDHNGHGIDVSTTRGLSGILAEIDANPNKYRASPPPPVRAPRSMADQAADLHRLYHEIGLTPHASDQSDLAEILKSV